MRNDLVSMEEGEEIIFHYAATGSLRTRRSLALGAEGLPGTTIWTQIEAGAPSVLTGGPALYKLLNEMRSASTTAET